MTAFVTGGSGFVGRELIQALAPQKVKALARSSKSEDAVRRAGAEPVKGDLDSIAAMQAGMAGCDLVYHCAAHTEEWDTDEAFHRVNVLGTDHLLAAAKGAGVKRVVLISSEAVLADGRKIVDADETTPYPDQPLRGYPATKGLCERHVLAANADGLETVVVRPRYIWGRGDTANLIKFAQALKDGRLAWVDQGRYLTSTCHVANVCEGALLAARKGKPAEIYFLTDGKPVEFRWFLTEVLKTQGLTPGTKSFPRWAAWSAASAAEAWARSWGSKKAPFATKIAIALMGQQITVSDAKARRELGYEGKMSIEAGLAEMAKLPPVKATGS